MFRPGMDEEEEGVHLSSRQQLLRWCIDRGAGSGPSHHGHVAVRVAVGSAVGARLGRRERLQHCTARQTQVERGGGRLIATCAGHLIPQPTGVVGGCVVVIGSSTIGSPSGALLVGRAQHLVDRHSVDDVFQH
eukprot:6238456-Prymnesium_polylepis.1